jgi:hypothetical protein
VAALLTTYAAVALVPGRSRRAERIAGAVIAAGTAAILVALTIQLYTGG